MPTSMSKYLPDIHFITEPPEQLKTRAAAFGVAFSKAFFVGLTYYITTQIGFLLTPKSYPIAMFWPPNAILMVAFIATQVRLWPWLLIAVVPAHFGAQLPTGIPFSMALGWLVGNVGEAVLGALLVKRFVKPDELFGTVYGTKIFLICGVLIPTVTTSFIDAGFVVLTGWGTDYWGLVVTRLFSNILAQLTLVPILIRLVFNKDTQKNRIIHGRLLEALLLMVLLVSLCLSIFTEPVRKLPSAYYIPFPLLLWAAVRFGPTGLSASTLVVTLVAVVNGMRGQVLFGESNPAEFVLSFQIFVCLVTIPLLLLATLLSERRILTESLLDSRARVLGAQDEERQRIARELHDDFGQRLTAAQYELYQIGKVCSPFAGEQLEHLRSSVARLSEDLRNMSHSLHPYHIGYVSLETSMQEMATSFGNRTGIITRMSYKGEAGEMRLPIMIGVYRIAQEALQNIDKHSDAREASIDILHTTKRITISIADDGCGFSRADIRPGLGFTSMQERAFMIGGRLKITSVLRRGTVIRVDIPLHAERPASVA